MSWNRSSHIIQVPNGINIIEFLFQRKKYYNICSRRNKCYIIFVLPGTNIMTMFIINVPKEQILCGTNIRSQLCVVLTISITNSWNIFFLAGSIRSYEWHLGIVRFTFCLITDNLYSMLRSMLQKDYNTRLKQIS